MTRVGVAEAEEEVVVVEDIVVVVVVVVAVVVELEMFDKPEVLVVASATVLEINKHRKKHKMCFLISDIIKNSLI